MDANDGQAGMQIQILHTDPKVTYSAEPFADEEGAGGQTIQETSETSAGLYKKIDVDSPECQKSAPLDGSKIKDLETKVKHEMLANVATLSDGVPLDGVATQIVQVDLKKWIEPMLSRRVGITLAQFFESYMNEYHASLAEAFDQKSPDASKTLIDLVGSSYSKISMLSSFVQFLSTKQSKDEDEAFLMELHKQLEEYTAAEFPKILILMNINGCLVHRTDEKIQFLKPQPGSEERNDPKWQRFVTMMRQKKHSVYFREGYQIFLRSLMRHPRCEYGFYSAIMQKNIQPVLIKMFEGDDSLYHEHMFAIFDQQFCQPSQEVTGKKYGFIRDLNQVWASNACKAYAQESGKAFGAENTIMLESEEEQCFNCWRNSLVIDRYQREDVWPTIGKQEEHRDQLAILRQIRDDLFKILDTATGDVREFLATKCGNASEEAQITFSPHLQKAKKVKRNGDPAQGGELVEATSDDEKTADKEHEVVKQEKKEDGGAELKEQMDALKL